MPRFVTLGHLAQEFMAARCGAGHVPSPLGEIVPPSDPECLRADILTTYLHWWWRRGSVGVGRSFLARWPGVGEARTWPVLRPG